MYTPENIGSVIVAPGVVRDKTYETAAWYTRLELTPGTYPLVGLFETYGPHSGVRAEFIGTRRLAWVTFTVPGTILEDNFQSLWAGVAFGSPYDRHQNAGKPATWTAQLYSWLVARAIATGTNADKFTYQLLPTWEVIQDEPNPQLNQLTYSLLQKGA